MRAKIFLLATLVLIPALQGCGQKGDLYLPEPGASDRAGTERYDQPARDDEDAER